MARVGQMWGNGAWPDLSRVTSNKTKKGEREKRQKAAAAHQNICRKRLLKKQAAKNIYVPKHVCVCVCDVVICTFQGTMRVSTCVCVWLEHLHVHRASSQESAIK